MSKTWVVSFQDGEDPTYVVLDELPIVALIDDEDLNDPNFRLPADCTDFPHKHIHIQDLIRSYKNFDAGGKE